MGIAIGCIVLILFLMFWAVAMPQTSIAAEQTGNKVDIMFLHDTHSHLNAFTTVEGTENVTMGGFARIKTLINAQKAKNPDTLLLDAGDFSMGTLVQAVYEEEAAELRSLGALGIDATTFGNHEFDYRAKGISNMLNAAVKSGDALPSILLCNMDWEAMKAKGLTEDQQLILDAFENYGVKDYMVVEKGGVDIAIIGQYAENVYFGKPCGLMDQMACSVGNLVHIDFENPKEPKVEKLDFNMSEHGYSLCITDTKGSHADLTAEYAAVPQEMKRVANHFGKEVLREVGVLDVIEAIPQLREKYGDRSVLRALHFFTENERVQKEVNALKWGDMNLFLDNVKESGDSSFKYLQNVYSNNDVENQNISIALMMSDVLLKTEGVSRVHGGGFAGTIQAFVKNDFVVPYKMQMDSIYGEGSCKDLRIRKYGGMKVI